LVFLSVALPPELELFDLELEPAGFDLLPSPNPASLAAESIAPAKAPVAAPVTASVRTFVTGLATLPRTSFTGLFIFFFLKQPFLPEPIFSQELILNRTTKTIYLPKLLPTNRRISQFRLWLRPI
jgi:hypothetical protein